MDQTVVQAVLRHAGTQPEKLAAAFKTERLTYADLSLRLRQCAALLREQGIGRGDVVMLTAVSRPEYLVMLLGIQYLGAVSVPLDKSAKEANILDVYHFISPKLLITDAKLTEEGLNRISLKALWEQIPQAQPLEDYTLPEDPDAVSEMLFTTGTTGKPKGAMLTYRNTLHSTCNTRDGIGMVPEDVVLLPLPLNHSVGMRVSRTTLYIGATLVLQNGFTFARELENNIRTFGCTGLVSVPASMEMVHRQMQEQFVPVMQSLRYIEIGAGSLSYDMKKKLLQELPNTELHNTWGSTETGGAIFLNVTRNPEKLTSLGRPMAGVELKVVDTKGREICARDIDTAGRMILRGPMQMAGYYNMPEVNAQTLVDGWLYTNDLVYTDADGFVYMLGRADDIINVGGEKVSPIEVENVGSEFPGVRECACIGAADPAGILGRIPVLFVVPENGSLDEKALTRFLAERLEKYKLPQKYVYLEELPRNRMQKLDRKALYARWEENGQNTLTNEVIRNIRARRSIREFTDEPIPRDVLETVVNTAICAPSGKNLQTWRFTVIQDAAKIEQFRAVVQEAAQRNKSGFFGFRNPKALVLVSNDRRNDDGIQDSACAVENMMLAAASLGLGSVWVNALMRMCDDEGIRALLDTYGIPREHIVWCTLALGYPAGEGKAVPRKQNVIRWIE